MSTPVKRALMITTSKYDNFDEEELKKEILAANEKYLVINKNEIAQIKHYEFFVRNCEPETGLLDNQTQITIENKDIMSISKVKIAVIKV
jgi:Leucine-rich repeat (LRR) protein